MTNDTCSDPAVMVTEADGTSYVAPKSKTRRVSTPPAPAVVPQAWMQRVERLLERVVDEAECRENRHDLSSQPEATPISDSSKGVRPDGIGDDDEMEPEIWDLLLGSIGSSLLVVTGLNIHDRVVFRDPIEEGVVSENGFRSIYATFLERMSRYLPVERLFPDAHDLHEPFMRCCVLDYVYAGMRNPEAPLSSIRRVQALLRHNLNCLEGRNPSPSVMLGLLVLSMSPLDPSQARFARQMDGRGHIGRAVTMAHAYGLDDFPVRASRETTAHLMGPGSELLLSRSLLWHVLSHRSAWVDIFSSPSFATRALTCPGPSATYPREPMPAEPLIAHLLLEERLLQLIAEVSSAVQRVRNETYQETCLNLAEHAIQSFVVEVESWRRVVQSLNLPTSAWLCLQSYHVQMLLPFKFTTDMRVLIPSPIQRDHIRCVFERLVGTFLEHTRNTLHYVAHSSIDMATLPAFALTLSLIPYHINAVVSRMHNDLGYLNSIEAQFYRQSLAASHPTAPLLIGRLDCKNFHSGWKMDQTEQMALPAISFGDFPPHLVDDLLNWMQMSSREDGGL